MSYPIKKRKSLLIKCQHIHKIIVIYTFDVRSIAVMMKLKKGKLLYRVTSYEVIVVQVRVTSHTPILSHIQLISSMAKYIQRAPL